MKARELAELLLAVPDEEVIFLFKDKERVLLCPVTKLDEYRFYNKEDPTQEIVYITLLNTRSFEETEGNNDLQD